MRHLATGNVTVIRIRNGLHVRLSRRGATSTKLHGTLSTPPGYASMTASAMEPSSIKTCTPHWALMHSCECGGKYSMNQRLSWHGESVSHNTGEDGVTGNARDLCQAHMQQQRY